MNNEWIGQLLEMGELCITISEGMGHVISGLSDDNLMNDIAEAINTVTLNFPFQSHQDPTFYREAARQLIGALKDMDAVYDDIMDNIWKAWQNTSFDSINGLIMQELNKESYICKEESEILLHYLSRIPVQPESYSKLLFLICFKCRHTNPEDAYYSMMELVKQSPHNLPGLCENHPDYEYQETEQTLFDACPVCGEGNGIPYYTGLSYRMKHFSHPFEPVKLWMKCGGCGNIYTRKFPTAFLQLGSKSQMITPSGDNQDKILPVTGLALSNWCDILTKLSHYNSGKNLLEVGIGTGELLAVALELGYRTDAVEIIEETAVQIAHALGISIWNGDFLNYETNSRYSVITMGDVIEHVSDPVSALVKACDLLEEDGVLWISTPNFESSFSRMRKFEDAMWCEPLHISYFSYRGLEKLLTEIGFRVMEYKVSNRYNGSMELILTKKKSR